MLYLFRTLTSQLINSSQTALSFDLLIHLSILSSLWHQEQEWLAFLFFCYAPVWQPELILDWRLPWEPFLGPTVPTRSETCEAETGWWWTQKEVVPPSRKPSHTLVLNSPMIRQILKICDILLASYVRKNRRSWQITSVKQVLFFIKWSPDKHYFAWRFLFPIPLL